MIWLIHGKSVKSPAQEKGFLPWLLWFLDSCCKSRWFDWRNVPTRGSQCSLDSMGFTHMKKNIGTTHPNKVPRNRLKASCCLLALNDDSHPHNMSVLVSICVYIMFIRLWGMNWRSMMWPTGFSLWTDLHVGKARQSFKTENSVHSTPHFNEAFILQLTDIICSNVTSLKVWMLVHCWTFSWFQPWLPTVQLEGQGWPWLLCLGRGPPTSTINPKESIYATEYPVLRKPTIWYVPQLTTWFCKQQIYIYVCKYVYIYIWLYTSTFIFTHMHTHLKWILNVFYPIVEPTLLNN